jgi:hypothetical protein
MDTATVPARSRVSTAFGFAPLAATAAGSAGLLVVGRRVSVAPFAVLCALAFGGYVLVLTRPPLDRRVILATTGLLLTLAVAIGPRASSDLWAYAMYGRIVSVHHENPYRVPPQRFPRDPALDRVQPVFRDDVSVYGPAFTALSAAGTWATGSSKLATRLFFQGTAALAVLLAMAVVARKTKDPRAMAFLGLHPVVLVSVVGDGHNDALVGLAVLGAVVLALQRPATAGLLLGLAASTKATAVLPLAAVAAWMLVRRGGAAAARLTLAASATLAAAYAAAGGTVAVRPVTDAARMIARHSIWHALAPNTARFAAGVAVLAVAILVLSNRVRDQDPSSAAGASLAPYLVGATYVLPWHAAAALPTLALRRRDLAAWIVSAHMMVLFCVYPDLRPPSEVQRWFATVLMPVLEAIALVALAFAGLRRARAGPAETLR